jgi:Holliday junction resolvase RusA-like endonuclease
MPEYRQQTDCLVIPIKPMSVNKAWGGRTFKSKEYKKYIKDVNLLLPAKIAFPDNEMILCLDFYFSSKASDLDNPIKPIQDIIFNKYGLDDKHVYSAIQRKFIVKRGEERIEVRLYPLTNRNQDAINSIMSDFEL